MTPTDLKDMHDAEMQGSDASKLNRADMFDVFLRELRGADRVVVETMNALGEYDAYYLHAPTILGAWNTRADLAPDRAAFEQMREALRPFEAAVFNDNGDVTISTGHITRADWLALAAALKAAEKAE